MKNKVEDVRNLVVSMMEALDDDTMNADDMAQRIERAKATSMLAGQFVGLVKVEIDAIRLLDDTGRLPASVSEPATLPKPALRAIGGR
jgi:hypothetical protein